MVFGVDDEPAGNDVAVGEPAWSESFLDGGDVAGPVSNDVLCDESSHDGADGAALDGSAVGARVAGGLEGDGPLGHDPTKGDPALNGSSSGGAVGVGSSGLSSGRSGRVELLNGSPSDGAPGAGSSGSSSGRSGDVELLNGSSVGVEALNGSLVGVDGVGSDGLSSEVLVGARASGGCGIVEFDCLVEAVDAALGIDFVGVPAGMLADVVPLMAAVLNRVQAVDARFVEALDASGVWARRGHRNVTAMLACGNAHRSNSASRARRASRLVKMRYVEVAFVAGDITVDHVRLLGELTQRRWLESFVEAESYLVKSAVELSWREFAHVVEV